jgi:HK97 family phage major capsid protein
VDNDLDSVLAEIKQELVESNQRARGNALVRAGTKSFDDDRQGSRYVGPNASESLVKHVANGGTIETAPRLDTKGYGGGGLRFDTGGSVLRGAKALSSGTGSSGGYVTFPQLLPQLTPMLQARTCVLAMGATVIPVEKELDVAGLSTSATASFVAENASISVSEETFTGGKLVAPRALAALVPVSNTLLRTAQVSPPLEDGLRSDLATVLALRMDLAFLRGTGTGVEPLGLANRNDLTPAPDLGANGSSLTFDNLKDVVAALRDANALFLNPGWIFAPRTINTLEKMKTSTGAYLADNPNLLSFDATGGGGKLLGFQFRTSTQIPTNLTVGTSDNATQIFFSSDWQELIVGQGLSLTIEMSTEASYFDGTNWISAYQNDQTLLRAITSVDAAPRRPALFSVLEGVRP